MVCRVACWDRRAVRSVFKAVRAALEVAREARRVARSEPVGTGEGVGFGAGEERVGRVVGVGPEVEDEVVGREGRAVRSARAVSRCVRRNESKGAEEEGYVHASM